MGIRFSAMSLKHYLFILIGVFVLLLAGVQVAFINYVQQQLQSEIEDKSIALSEQAVRMVVDARRSHSQTTNNHDHSGLQVHVRKTPGVKVELGEGYRFKTGDETRTITVSRSVSDPAPQPLVDQEIDFLSAATLPEVHQINISRFGDAYTFAVGYTRENNSLQNIVEFNREDSALNRYFAWLLTATAGLAAIGLLLAYWLAKHISHPLHSLSKGFANVEAGKLGSQVKSEGIREVQNTLNQFNHMSNRLAELNEMEKRYARQSQLAELGEVARGLAHTLRNPLNTIGLAVEQLAQPSLDEAKQIALAQQIRHKIQRLDNTIKALLNLTASGVERTQPVDLVDIVQDVIMELSMHATVPVAFSAAQSVSLKGAHSELRMLVHTLISNAVEASAAGQSVAVFLEQQQALVTLRVIDQGTGISNTVADKLFGPHVTSKPEGAGMGLYIAQRLCQSYYHGQITLTNNDEHGCTAKLTLKDADHE